MTRRVELAHNTAGFDSILRQVKPSSENALSVLPALHLTLHRDSCIPAKAMHDDGSIKRMLFLPNFNVAPAVSTRAHEDRGVARCCLFHTHRGGASLHRTEFSQLIRRAI